MKHFILVPIFFTVILAGLVGYVIWNQSQLSDENSLNGVMNRFNPTRVEQVQAFILPVVDTNYLPIRNFTVAEPRINARAALLMDMNSGKTLYALNADQELPIASITKLATAVAVLENLDLKET